MVCVRLQCTQTTSHDAIRENINIFPDQAFYYEQIRRPWEPVELIVSTFLNMEGRKTSAFQVCIKPAACFIDFIIVCI